MKHSNIHGKGEQIVIVPRKSRKCTLITLVISWQQHSAFRHADTACDLLKITLSISMGHKGDLSDSNVAGLSNSETVDLLGFSHTSISRLYREWPETEKKIQWAPVLSPVKIPCQYQMSAGNVQTSLSWAVKVTQREFYSQGLQTSIPNETWNREADGHQKTMSSSKV